MTTFVSLGNANQPFNRIIKAVLRIAHELPQPVVVQYGHTFFDGADCIKKQFMEMDEYGNYISGAELLILHAGAGSVIHAVQAGKVPVVMPRQAKYGEHVDDHQLEFARALEEMGKVVIVEEPHQLAEAVHRALQRQQMGSDVGCESTMIQLVGETISGYVRELECKGS